MDYNEYEKMMDNFLNRKKNIDAKKIKIFLHKSENNFFPTYIKKVFNKLENEFIRIINFIEIFKKEKYEHNDDLLDRIDAFSVFFQTEFNFFYNFCKIEKYHFLDLILDKLRYYIRYLNIERRYYLNYFKPNYLLNY